MDSGGSGRRRQADRGAQGARRVPDTARDPLVVEARLPITLGQFVKLAGLAPTGGDAKMLVVGGQVRVNDAVDTRRGRKLAFGDVVSIGQERAVVTPRQEDLASGMLDDAAPGETRPG